MKWRGLKSILEVVWHGPGASSFPISERFRKGDPLFQPGAFEFPFAQHPVVHTAISRMARDAACVPWEFFPDDPDQDTPIKNHPVAALWARPNDRMSGNMLWAATYIDVLNSGEAFWYYPELQQGRGRTPPLNRLRGEIELLRPGSVMHEVSASGVVSWFVQRKAGKMPLNTDRLTHFCLPNPYDPHRGLSPLTPLMLELEGDFYAQKWNAHWFRTGALPSVALTPGANDLMQKEQRDEVLSSWTDRHAGKNKPGILPPGWSLEKLSMSQHDMDFRVLRDFSREMTLSTLGLVPFVAGVLEHANYANARAQKSVYWGHAIKPLVTDAAAVVNHDFLRKLGIRDVTRPKLEGTWANLDDADVLSQVAKRYWDMGVPFRQVNEQLNLGFDPEEIPTSDESFIPINLLPQAAGAGLGGQLAVKDTKSEAARFTRWTILTRQFRDLEVRLDRLLRSHMEGLRKEVMGKLTKKEVKQGEEFFLFDLDDADKRLRRVSRPVFEQTVRRAGESLAGEIGIGTVFDLGHPLAMSILQSREFLIRHVNRKLFSDLKESLQQGFAAGETFDSLRDRVRDVFRLGQGRSRTIARTETQSAFNEGRQAAMAANGVSVHEWLTSRDADVRDSHRAIDSQRRSIGEPFSNGLRFPLDPAGPVGEAANCRCVSIPIVEAA